MDNFGVAIRIIATVMDWLRPSSIGWLFDAQHGAPDRLIPRWLFLRALGAIYFSAFFSLTFQIRGLIGPDGILPAAGTCKRLLNHSVLGNECGMRRRCSGCRAAQSCCTRCAGPACWLRFSLC